jgi:hypothetical protein
MLPKVTVVRPVDAGAGAWPGKYARVGGNADHEDESVGGLPEFLMGDGRGTVNCPAIALNRFPRGGRRCRSLRQRRHRASQSPAFGGWFPGLPENTI